MGEGERASGGIRGPMRAIGEGGGGRESDGEGEEGGTNERAAVGTAPNGRVERI